MNDNLPRPDMSQTAKAQIRLQQGTYSSDGEILDYCYYDSQRLAAAVFEHSYFINGVGEMFSDGGAVVKNFSDVNFPGRGMPAAQNFEVRAIGLIYRPDEVRTEAEMVNIVDMLKNSKFSFFIGNKAPVLELPLLDLAGNSFPVVKAAAAVADDHMRSMVRTRYPLNISIPLAGNTKFHCLLQHSVAVAAGIAADKLTICLQGVLQRLS